MKAPEAAISGDGQLQQIKMSPSTQRSYIAISPPFLPNYPIAVSTAPPLQQVQAISPRNRISKPSRPPCHHARYILGDKPKRTPMPNSNIVCTNCGTRNTSAWRRSAEGKSECNACNLFFRKNGRKRPQSMRRDTIARRYRLSRCELCEMEAQNAALACPVQPQRKRARRGVKAKTPQQQEAAVSTQNGEELSAIPTVQTSLPQRYFIAHPGFQQPLQILAPNLRYVHQNPVVMSYATDRAVFNVVNADQQVGAAVPLDRKFCFVRNASSGTPFPPQYQVAAIERISSTTQVNPVENPLIKEKSVSENGGTTAAQPEMSKQYQQSEQQENYAVLKENPEKSGFDGVVSVKKECIEANYNNVPGPTDSTPLFEEIPVNSDSKQNLHVSSQHVEEKPQEKDEAGLVFRSL